MGVSAACCARASRAAASRSSASAGKGSLGVTPASRSACCSFSFSWCCATKLVTLSSGAVKACATSWRGEVLRRRAASSTYSRRRSRSRSVAAEAPVSSLTTIAPLEGVLVKASSLKVQAVVLKARDARCFAKVVLAAFWAGARATEGVRPRPTR